MEFLSRMLAGCKYQILFTIALMLTTMANLVCAQTIIVGPNTVISTSKVYDNVTLDMTAGSFIIKNHATLTIRNSNIKGVLSKSNPTLFTLENGNLRMRNNAMAVNAVGIIPHPYSQSLEYVIQVAWGNVVLENNRFKVDDEFSVGFLITTSALFPNKDFKITGNRFEKFHGVLYLVGTERNIVSKNVLIRNSYGNIVVIGSDSKVTGNIIYFSGNNKLGDSIDVIDSSNVLVSGNLLLTPTCRGIFIFNSRDITVDRNRIFGGITYAMKIVTYPETMTMDIKDLLAKVTTKPTLSSNIVITNNFMSQNRYGIAANDVNGMTVTNNTFVQRFEDNSARKFWTNNAVLFKNVTSLVWSGNLYKEAFSQEEGSNSHSFELVDFPVSGGVSF